MSIIARLGAKLGLDTQEFVKGVDAAQQKSKEFKKQLRETQQTVEGIKTAFAAASAAFIAFAAHAVHAADNLQDLAEANDTTVGKIIELQQALQKAGGESANAGKFYDAFTKAIDSAAQGNDALRDSFKELGISTKDLGILTNEQLKNKAIEGLSKIDDVVRRNALGAEMFSKAAKGVNFIALNEQIKAGAGHYDSMAKAVKEAADSVGKIEVFIHDMEIAALTAISPVLKLFNSIPSEHRIEAMTKAFQALGVAIGVAFGVTAVKGVITFGSALRAIAITNPWLLALTAAGGAAAYFGLDKLLGGEEDASDAGAGDSNAVTGKPRSIELSQRDKMILKYKQQMDVVKQLAALEMFNINSKFVAEKNLLELEDRRYSISTNQYELEKLFYDIVQKRLDLDDRKEKALNDARRERELASVDEAIYAEELYQTKVKAINNNFEYEKGYLNQIEQLRMQNFNNEIERQQSWQYGWDEAFKRYSESAERASERGAAAFESVMTNMESLLKNFVETGKLNFKDFVGSVVKDLLYMEMKAQATSLFKSIFGSIMGSFGGKSFEGLQAQQYPGRASGGYVDRPSIVGENGAELFIPRTPGTIIPNGSWQQMASSGGGGLTVNGPYIANMSAIDTQSGTQFLASNKNTIWAAYQSANRSIPISR